MGDTFFINIKMSKLCVERVVIRSFLLRLKILTFSLRITNFNFKFKILDTASTSSVPQYSKLYIFKNLIVIVFGDLHRTASHRHGPSLCSNYRSEMNPGTLNESKHFQLS